MSGTEAVHSNRRLVRNAVINAGGFIFIALVLFFAYPHLFSALGEERMGVLLLILTVVGYFSIFDLGINRALTRFLALQFSKGETKQASETLSNGLFLLLILGLVVTVLVVLIAPVLIDDSDVALYDEAVASIRLISLSLVFLLVTAGLRSVLEAQQKFFFLNLITVPASMFNYLGPMVLSFFTNQLTPIALLILTGRIAVFFVMLTMVVKTNPALLQIHKPAIAVLRRLARFGGWMTVTRLINPFFMYFDRFFISATLTLEAVAFYTTPFEVTTRILILAQTFIAVLFPAFSALAGSDPERLESIRNSSLKIGVGGFAAIAAVTVLVADPFLSWWIGPELAARSSLILQVLITGSLVNYAAHFPATILQAVNRPDISAKMHIVELPLYIGLLVLAVNYLGILGASLAWVFRVTIDAVLHFFFAERHLPTRDAQDRMRLWSLGGGATALMAGSLAVSYLAESLAQLALWGGLLLLAFSLFFWLLILTGRERRFIVKLLLLRRREL